MKEKMLKRGILSVMGNVLIAIGIVFLRFSSFGTDPFTAMNLGVSGHLPIDYGTYQLLVNCVLFIPVILFYRKAIGLGTLVNMAGLGYMVDFLMQLVQKAGFFPESLLSAYFLRILCLILGVLIVCLGVALYMECDMGISPYDALGPIIEKGSKGKLPFQWVRVGTDILCILVGYLSGSIIGIGTIITAFCTGPVVGLLKEKVCKKIVS